MDISGLFEEFISRNRRVKNKHTANLVVGMPFTSCILQMDHNLAKEISSVNKTKNVMENKGKTLLLFHFMCL